MPNSGKTSVLLDLDVNQPDSYWVFGDSARRSFGMLKQEQTGIDFNQFTLTQILRSNSDISYALDSIYFAYMTDEHYPKKSVVFERDYTDIPFIRANFLFGRIDIKILDKAENKFYENLNRFKGLPRTIISCLVHPTTSKKREKEQKEHTVIQDKFLSCLYEQYLRFHYEMLNFRQVYKQEHPFNYVGVNMSGTNLQINVKKLEKYINQIQQTNLTYQQATLI